MYVGAWYKASTYVYTDIFAVEAPKPQYVSLVATRTVLFTVLPPSLCSIPRVNFLTEFGAGGRDSVLAELPLPNYKHRHCY